MDNHSHTPANEIIDRSEQEPTPEVARALEQIYELDPTLFEHEDTRLLVELGVQYGQYVTEAYGTPDQPHWTSGTHETDVLMGYHNGGDNGHTSVGGTGAGVPRNVLVIAKEVNNTAGGEVYSPPMRALLLYVAYAHDTHQLCGRSLLPEGRGEQHGDERMSAEMARDVLLEAGYDEQIAEQAYEYLMATAFNPVTSAQNVNYDTWDQNPHDASALASVLGQELVAAADLLSPSVSQGPLGSIQYTIEMMCLTQYGQQLQGRLQTLGVETSHINTMEEMLTFIGDDEILRPAFISTLVGQVKFFADYLHYSDRAIRTVCGQGIDDLFAGRQQNIAILERYVAQLEVGASPLEVWEDARRIARG